MSASTDEQIDRDADTATLRAMVHTLLGRVEALEQTVAKLKDREQRIRRAVGSIAAAFDLTK